jgi:hypothetical protein
MYDGPLPPKHALENWAVLPGLDLFFAVFPALKRWAKLVRPSGAGFPQIFSVRANLKFPCPLQFNISLLLTA